MSNHKRFLLSGGGSTTVTAPVAGTANTVAKFTGAATIGNSTITDDGTLVNVSNGLGIGASSPIAQLDVTGGNIRGGGSSTTFTQTTDNPLTAGATTINVGSTTGFPTKGVLILSPFNQTGNAEFVTYTGTTATSFTGVTRGVYGTTGVSHAVSCNIVAPLILISPDTATVPTMWAFHWNGTAFVYTAIGAAGITSGSNGPGTYGNAFWANGGIFSSNNGQAFLRASGTNAINVADNAANNVNLAAGGGVVNFGASNNKAVMGTGGKFTTYNAVATAGYGNPAIYAAGRSAAQTAAVASVATYTNGAADGTFEVSANVLITASTTFNFTVTCAYTDEGNTARTLTFNFSNVGGTIATAIANAGGAVPYMGIPLHIRCKASTAITIATTGTFTTVTYNVEGCIRQLA